MSAAQDGGPAFPYVTASEAVREVTTHEGEPGMTLRDYFIAHAPTEPQPWFRPKMPHPHPVAPPQPSDLTDEERHDLEGYREDMLGVGDVRSSRLAAYLREMESWKTWGRAWRQDEAKQAYIQWPAAWADEMLKARAA